MLSSSVLCSRTPQRSATVRLHRRRPSSSVGAGLDASQAVLRRATTTECPAVASFFVGEFFYEDPSNNVQDFSTGKATLVVGQTRDFLSRYGRRDAAMIVAEDPDTGAYLGCVGVNAATLRRPQTVGESRRVSNRGATGPRGIDVRREGAQSYADWLRLNAASDSLEGALIANLAVASGARRRGLARRLVAEAEAFAREELGETNAVLLVDATNGKAMRLYERLGYKRRWTVPDAETILLENGRLRNAKVVNVCMRKNISKDAIASLDNMRWQDALSMSLASAIGATSTAMLVSDDVDYAVRVALASALAVAERLVE